MENKRRSRRRQLNASAWFGPMSFILVCISVVVAMSIFFRVSTVEVEGNQDYTDEEIVAATGIDAGDNLFFLNRIGAVSRMMARLPYIQEATVSRVLPDKVVINVRESNAIATVQSETSAWMIDRNCKMMTAVTESEAMGLIPVTGITAVLPNVGDPIQPKEGDDGKIEYLSEILLEIEVRGLQSRISEIDFTDPDNPSLFFDDRFEVKLGARDDTIRKFGLFLSASQQLASGDMGVIDLSIDDKAHFIQH
ncbi:MAG: FtsQ-type POTRA domain-containing protein [Oscillospiraceae bacterium]|nr:FtsQ-type POTRA domain-containing protein [Oscillospiraceae bacterium]